MAQRYIRQIEFTNSVDLPECTVALEKGAVLLDTKTNTYFLQLKLANIGAVPVTSVKVYVEAFDREGNPAYSEKTPGIAAEYNEFVSVGETFGTKQLLPVPNNNAVTFHVYVEQVTTNSGLVLNFPRERYVTGGIGRDIAKEREKALEAEREMQERMAKEYRIKWGAIWYHAIFVIWIFAYFMLITGGRIDPYLFSELSRAIIPFLFLIIIPSVILIVAWISIGTPKILKNTAKIAIIIPLLHFLQLILSPDSIMAFYYFQYKSRNTAAFFIRDIIICAIPFLCVFFNARRLDKSLSFKRALMFWLPE